MASRVVHLRPPVPAHVAQLVIPDAPSDESLVLRARTGDRRAEEGLYRRHASYVLGLATRLLASDSEGEDVMQESFCVAFDKVRELRDPSAFRPWLASIAVSQARRKLRRRKFLKLFGGILDEGGLADLRTVEATGEALAELALLSTKLAKLSADERIAWSLRYVEGHSLEEAAALVGCSLSTFKRRLEVAKLRVQAHFGGYDE